MLTTKELLNSTDKELALELKKARKSLLQYKMGVKSGQEKAIHKIKEHKKYIAQILSVMAKLNKEEANKESEGKDK